MKQIVVTVRALIISNGLLMMCRHNQTGRTFYNLPGGKLEVGETIQDGMIRELTEETGVIPQLGNLMFINQYRDGHNHRIEFFFNITNAASYASFNPATASHAFEVAHFEFGNPSDPRYDIRPAWISQRWDELRSHPGQFKAELVESR